MFLLWSHLVLTLLHHSLAKESGYLRNLLVGTSVYGTVVKTMSAEKVQDCAQAWFNDTIVAISYNTTDNKCEGFSKVLGIQSEEGTVISYMFTKGSSDTCSINVFEDFNKIADCRNGWFKIIINGTAYCYYALKADEYNKTISTVHDIVFACKKLYPFSDSASIHSYEEEEALLTNPTLLSILNPMNLGGIGIGMHLTPDNYDNYKDTTKWVWADKSPVTYTNWNMAYGCPYCSQSGTICSYVVMMTDGYKWYQCDISWKRPILCKYQL
ncbi:hypothetical protein QR680_011646 [Steinernema hermaphroditum]|uniref:C-type lectin domain-containing protein n=1 Tax=Steinernema hermaphroditum TaxID=289476 RepID=A0AA39HZ87_9BILA|nr:hypothetical protein QR680_011646 [Steinernema hermaphroditum]